MPTKKSKPIDEELRHALLSHRATQKTISEESGVDEAQLSRFMNGQDIRLKTAAKLASYLGLHLKA
jgi:transcriptional regulator with XRE-family HTH domain